MPANRRRNVASSLTLPSGNIASRDSILWEKAFLDLYHNVPCLQFEYTNPLAGLGMIIIGLFLMVFGYWVYGITPVAVGIALIVLYRKYLMRILGNAD